MDPKSLIIQITLSQFKLMSNLVIGVTEQKNVGGIP